MNQKDDPSKWLFVFAFAYAFMHIVPVLLPFEWKNRLTYGDLLSFLTPFAVLLPAWKLYSLLWADDNKDRRWSAQSAFWILLVSSLLYTSGHGINLAANAIGRCLRGSEATPIYHLTYFFDETLGHILWHAGVVGTSIALLLASMSMEGLRTKWTAYAAAPLFALTYFTDGVEGQTVFMLFPAAILMAVWILYYSRRRRPIGQSPVMAFYLLGYALAIALFVFWGIWQRGYPEFSELGWIE